MNTDISIEIRQAGDGDYRLLPYILYQAINNDCRKVYGDRVVDAWLTGKKWKSVFMPPKRAFIAFEGKRAIGFCGWLDTMETPNVCGLFVLPKVKGRGVGRALLEATEADIAAHGYRHVELTATLNAEPLYRRCGYMPGEEVFLSVGQNISILAVHMEKELPCAQENYARMSA